MSDSSAASSSVEDEQSHSELDSWREVHGLLTKAVLVAKEAVAAKKVQRRFWLEEICANLNEGGKLTQNSVWSRPAPPKKTATKRVAKPSTAAPPAKKPRKKKSTDAPAAPATTNKTKKPKKKKVVEDDDNEDLPPARPKAKKIRLKLSGKTAATPPVPNSQLSDTSSPVAAAAAVDYDHQQQPDNSETDDDEEEDSDVETGGSVSHYGSGSASFMRAADYSQGDTQWGSAGQQVPLMGEAGSPESQYSPYGAGGGIQDQYNYFGQGAAAIQTGLHGQGVYSTYPSHQGGSDESSSEEEY